MHLYDIIIVGAGPSGCLAAIKLSQSGLKVLLIDKGKNRLTGERLGIADGNTLRLLNIYIKDSVKANINNFSLSYKNADISFELDGCGFSVFDINMFYMNLLDMCIGNGVEIKNNEYAIDVKMENYYVEIRTNNDTYRSRVAVGADGANSLIGKKSGIITGQDYCVGIEALYRTESIDDRRMDVDLSSIPYGYSMALNCGKWATLYAVSFYKGKVDIKKYFKKYIESMGFKDTEVHYIKGSLVSINNGRNQNFVNKRVALIGSAAKIGNPLTGTGLYYSAKSSFVLSDLILNEININNPVMDLSPYNEKMDLEVFKGLGQLYRLSKWLYKNKGISFKLIRQIPYAGRYCAGLICGRINPAEQSLFTPLIPWKSGNYFKEIRIIK